MALAVLLTAPSRADEPARSLSVEDAVKLALSRSPRLASVDAQRRGARELELSARGRLLPTVSVSEEYQHWNSPFLIALSASPGAPAFVARDQDTSTFVASAAQPLLGLLRLSQDLLAQRRSADAADAQYRVAAANLKQRVEVGYLRYFQARAQEEIARASQAELNEQATLAEVRLRAGVVTRADLLRVEVAAANAAQQVLAARTSGRVALADLLTTIGLPADANAVVLSEPTNLLAAPAGAPLPWQPAWQLALARRPEEKQLENQSAAAVHQRRSRLFSLLPDIAFEGAYQHLDGQVFAPVNAAFLGVRAQWAIWEWGATYYLYRAAAAQADSARFALEDETLQIGAEVSNGLAAVEEAASAVTVSEKAIAGAEEAYRETEAQLKAGTATTTDLIVAQAALTQARFNMAQARYQYAISRVNLSRALGE